MCRIVLIFVETGQGQGALHVQVCMRFCAHRDRNLRSMRGVKRFRTEVMKNETEIVYSTHRFLPPKA